MDELQRKIGILGAGISGLSAAVILAKKGYGVEVFEKRPTIGSFFEKDVHSLRNYLYPYNVIEEYKKLGIEISNFQPIFKELRFSSSGKNIEIYSKDKPLFYNVIRGYADSRSLDNELFNSAKLCGVKIYFNQNIKEEDPNINIIATGATKIRGVAFGAHYKIISGEKIDSIFYFSETKLVPEGYIYLSPFSDEISLVIATHNIENRERLKERFELVKEKNKTIREILKSAKFENEIYGFAFFDLPESAIKNGKLYIGEAAGFLDAVSGFGTHYAIISGFLVAKSIINKENYDKVWKQYFGEELKARFKKKLEMRKSKIQEYDKKTEEMLKKFGKRIPIEEYKKYF